MPLLASRSRSKICINCLRAEFSEPSKTADGLGDEAGTLLPEPGFAVAGAVRNSFAMMFFISFTEAMVRKWWAVCFAKRKLAKSLGVAN